MLSSAGIAASMSRKVNCYDNAPMESFFHTLKTERVHHCQYLHATLRSGMTGANPPWSITELGIADLG